MLDSVKASHVLHYKDLGIIKKALP